MIEKIDKIFSIYIRLRDTNDYGYGNCITCGKLFKYDEMECGHFRSRRNMATRWNVGNAHAQCIECNRKGDIAAYMIAMINLYGMGKASDIIEMSKISPKFTSSDYDGIYRYYRTLVAELLKGKMFKVKY